MELSSFKQFIVEAEDRGSDFSRVISAIEKRMPSLLGTKIYRYGGSDGVEQLKNQKGYLYFFGDGKAFRLREKGSEIVAFDVWKHYSPSATADYTLHTEGLSVAAITKELKKFAAFFKSPRKGDLPINNMEEGISFSFSDDQLLEAKAVPVEEFIKLASKDFSDAELKSLEWNQIVNIAKSNNVAIPNGEWLRGQKVGRGRWSLLPVEGGAANDEAKEPAKVKKDPILYIKVTAQDPDSKKFISAGDNKAAQALYSQIQDAMDGDRKPSKAEMRNVDTLFGHLYQLTSFACSGKLRSLLIYGGPGTGKTYTIMEAIKNAGLIKGKDYVKLSGKASATEIYKTLFMFREGGMILFDDLDSMWKDRDASNFLKAALDTSPVREISNASNNTINVAKMNDDDRKHLFAQIDKQIAGDDSPDEEDEDDEDGDDKPKKPKAPSKLKYPSTFEFKGRVVFISNLRKDEFDSAILSRSAKIDMSLTAEEVLSRMRSILPDLGGKDVSVEIKEEFIQVLVKLHKNREIDQVTMREFEKGLNIVRSGAPNWKDLVIYM
jgi:hypothetical protein